MKIYSWSLLDWIAATILAGGAIFYIPMIMTLVR